MQDQTVGGMWAASGDASGISSLHGDEAEQARYAALFPDRALAAAEGTNFTHYRHQRRLAPILGQNFAGINSYQGYVGACVCVNFI